MIRNELKFTILLAISALGGCAGNGEGLDVNGRPPSSSDPDGPLTADFESIQAHVFTPICTACHVGATAPQGLRLDEANSYDLLVGVASNEVPALQRVKPGDPDNSYIIQKLEGRAAVGAQMPFGGPPLSQATIDVIRQWITDGTQPPASASGVAAFELATMAPADGDVVTEAPRQIVLGFTRELDVTRADASAVRLERIGGSGETEVGTPVPADISVPTANTRALVLKPHQPLTDGRYRVLLDDRNGVGLSDLGGRRLPAARANEFGERVAAVFEVESVQ